VSCFIFIFEFQRKETKKLHLAEGTNRKSRNWCFLWTLEPKGNV